MIDYDKLEECHRLIEKLHLTRLILDYSAHHGEEYWLSGPPDAIRCPYNRMFTNVDDLLVCLRELTQPKPKYEIGQEVFFINTNEPEWKIESTKISCKPIPDGGARYRYESDGWDINESFLYPSRQSLIEAQIEYWTSLIEEGKC